MIYKKQILRRDEGYVFYVKSETTGRSVVRLIYHEDHADMTTKEKLSILQNLECDLDKHIGE
jgi:hypothetical protein